MVSNLDVDLSFSNSNFDHNLQSIKDRDLIYGMQTPQMEPFLYTTVHQGL